MSETYTKSAITDKKTLQNFQEAASKQQGLENTSFDEIFMLQNGKEKFIIGQKKTTNRAEGKYIDPHMESQAAYYIAPIKKGEIQPGIAVMVKSNEKYDWDVGPRWGTHEAKTTMTISKNNQQIYSASTPQYDTLDNLDGLQKVITDRKKISDQWRYEHSLPGKITKLTRDTSQKIGKQVENFKQTSLKNKFLIAAAGLTPAALTAACPEAVLAATIGTAAFASALAINFGALIASAATLYSIEDLCEKIKGFAKDAKENGAKTVAQTKIQEIKKRMNDRKKEKAKEKKLSHGDALALLAIAEPTQTVSPNSNTMAITPQREVF